MPEHGLGERAGRGEAARLTQGDLGGGPAGLPGFLAHLGPEMEKAWPALGTPAFDEPTLAVLTEQAKEFLAEGSVSELAAERDRRQIALLRTLDEAS
ncbi:hypothetical protein AB0J38_19060 [Streptomyces sp. NPDC050095]|uniref:hypothetical protein n=1 Tax=unclassified Streptomyces TaxID=2593676 RepID=UPI00343EC6C0